ncbi:flagellar biosynthesis protein FliQ [Alicyclobacillus macrosporangiidus]|uniref:Flagellar biosynthetic protein FliQ n=1 Tax=Alicyclobacillus macrosporangiidus TaxID=392015 RepID=A0A1I7IQY6_9BACL|nr:flagellar biosynthesis protein FliQ [Alicyclobacillus macrosporangiidus]SFU75328.1 flagellar biosynthetic protein FliQ [Alicyclobacillus macrosporangiidus]
MDANFIIGLGTQVMWLVVKLTAPILGLGLAAGVAVSLFQATTQIQEPTLSFVPKVAAVMAALLLFGPWMLTILVDFSAQVLGHLNDFVH